MQKKDRDGGNNAQRDEDEERDPHANREAVGKRGLTGRDSHEPREPFVEFHSMPSFRIRRTLMPSEDLMNTQAVFEAHDSRQGDLSERYPRPQPGRCPNFSRAGRPRPRADFRSMADGSSPRLFSGGVGFSQVEVFQKQLQLRRIELFTLGAEEPSDE